MMIKCLICGIEKETAREMHGHLIRVHYDDYKKSENDMEKLTSGYTRKSLEQKKIERKMKRMNTKAEKHIQPELKNERPKNLRLLNKNSENELAAYNEGYRYTDGDLCYTSAEVKEEGWI